MKAIAIAVSMLMLLSACRPDVTFMNPGRNTRAGLSSLLKYEIQFHPSDRTREAWFSATLTNVCPDTLKILVNDKEFHASFTVKRGTSDKYRIFDAWYRGAMLTAEWTEPEVLLGPSKSIAWTAPLSSLVAELGEPVTEESLLGCAVVGEMPMTIVPRASPDSTSDNANQTSATIKIAPKR